MKIEKLFTKNNNETYILAEIGINHDGDINKAKKLIKHSAKAGVDGVKFQLIHGKKLLAPFVKEGNKHVDNPAIDFFKRYELKDTDYVKLAEYADKQGVDFLCTPFDKDGLNFIDPFVKAHKISSGDITNLPLIKLAAKKNKPVILSTGMSNLRIIKKAVKTVKKTGNKKIILLHCVSNYPPEDPEVNLLAIKTLKDKFNLPVGFSDHTKGITAPIASYSIGARFIEKHVTLDSKAKGADHAMSIEINDLKKLVNQIRRTEKMLGTGIKTPAENEINIAKSAFRGVYAANDIKTGQKITAGDIVLLRPSTGFSPYDLKKIIGKKAKRNISRGHALEQGDF